MRILIISSSHSFQDETFSFVKKRLAEKLRVDPGSIVRLLFDGETLDGAETPRKYEMEDDDCVDVME